MSGSHRVVALIQERRLALARARLRELGLEPADVRVERFGGRDAAAGADDPRAPVRRSHLLLGYAAGAVPGAFAGLAIALGTGLGTPPAATLLAGGAIIGSLAVTGRVPRRRRAEPVPPDPSHDSWLRLDARCADGQEPRVRQRLHELGATVLEPSESPPPRPTAMGGDARAGRRRPPRRHPTGRHTARRPRGASGARGSGDPHDTPPHGLSPAPPPVG